ncbi:MAG: helix-turn-helix transcriptional regulator, partial [Oscillospiraceae bacterium]|nr:helix-turn-helix transcriptional regulator [Oscillospiraceae bacterium]
MGFAENLKEIRKQKNITQEELAEMLNVSRQAVSKWEAGNGYPETEKLLIIAKELNVSLDFLFSNEPNTTGGKTVAYAPSGKIAITTF